MTKLLGLDFTPLEEYETTEEQKLYAAMHAVGRVAKEELVEICAMFGLKDIAPQPLPADTIYCKYGHPQTPENVRTDPRPNIKDRCRPCERNYRTGENR